MPRFLWPILRVKTYALKMDGDDDRAENYSQQRG